MRIRSFRGFSPTSCCSKTIKFEGSKRISLFPIEPYLSGACVHRDPSVRPSGLLQPRKLCYSFIFKQLYCIFRSSYPACDFDLQTKKYSYSAPQFFPRPLKNRPHLDSSSEIPPKSKRKNEEKVQKTAVSSKIWRPNSPLTPPRSPKPEKEIANTPHSALRTIKMTTSHPNSHNFRPLSPANTPPSQPSASMNAPTSHLKSDTPRALSLTNNPLSTPSHL